MDRQKVLLFEEDGLLRRCMARSLERHGFEVTPLNSLEEALHRENDDPLILLVNDASLAGGRVGFSDLARIRKRFPQVLATLVSTSVDDEQARLARMAGFDLIVRRPSPLEEFRASVHAMRSHKYLRRLVEIFANRPVAGKAKALALDGAGGGAATARHSTKKSPRRAHENLVKLRIDAAVGDRYSAAGGG